MNPNSPTNKAQKHTQNDDTAPNTATHTKPQHGSDFGPMTSVKPRREKPHLLYIRAAEGRMSTHERPIPAAERAAGATRMLSAQKATIVTEPIATRIDPVVAAALRVMVARIDSGDVERDGFGAAVYGHQVAEG